MLRALLFILVLILSARPAEAGPIEGEMVCADARQGMIQRMDRIVVVTGFSTVDAIVVVTGFKGSDELACVLTIPASGVMPAMRLPVLCVADGSGRLVCRR